MGSKESRRTLNSMRINRALNSRPVPCFGLRQATTKVIAVEFHELNVFLLNTHHLLHFTLHS